MTAKELQVVIDLFPNCEFYTDTGLRIFDKNGDFMCVYFNEGFSVNKEYKYVNELKKKLEDNGFPAWWHQVMEEAKYNELMDLL